MSHFRTVVESMDDNSNERDIEARSREQEHEYASQQMAIGDNVYPL